jgi:hypothetical protein
MTEALPIIVGEWRRNGREVVRVTLGKYQSNHTIDIRLWYAAEDGTMRAGNKGITLAAGKHLRQLATALAEAERRAGELGLLTEGGSA